MLDTATRADFAPCLVLLAALFLLPALLPATCAASPVDALIESNRGIRRFVLENGMVCLIKEDHSAPVISAQIWVGTGSIHEEEFLGAGLSHYLEHMLFKGTDTRAPGDVSKDIDNAGGDINAYTSYEHTVFLTVIPSRHWETGVDVLADAIMNASLPEEEWQRERAVVQREVDMGRDDPDRRISKLLFRTAYRVHPYRHPIIGHEDILTTMTREQLVTFYERHYVPDNMITIVVGDIDSDEVEQRLRDLFMDFKRRPRAPVVVPEEPTQVAPRFERETGPFQVSRAEMAYHTVPLNHADAPALDVLAMVLGEGRSARLVHDLQETRQLVHEIEAWSYTPQQPGLFGVAATFDPDREAEVLSAIQNHIASWPDLEFTDAELDKAKRQLLVSELNDLQTVSGQARSLGAGEFFASDPAFSAEYLAQIDAVTVTDLKRVIDRYIQPRKQTLVILSPEAEVEPAGEKAAKAEFRPDVQMKTLSNGTRLLIREDHRLPFVYFSVAMGGGLLSESAEKSGITRLTADLLNRGTETRTAAEIAAEADSLGARIVPYSGNNSLGLNARCLTEDVRTVLDLVADCILNSQFPDEEMEKQRTLQIAEIASQRDRPIFVATEMLRGLLYPDHPYRRHALGSPETLERLNRDDLVAHYRRLAVASNLVLAVFGDIDAEQAYELTEESLAALPSSPPPDLSAADAAPVLPGRAERREPKEQSILLVGFPGVAVDDPRADALEVLGNALSGLSSDLVIEIRDKRGLVYYTGAYQSIGLEPGYVVFYAGTQEESVEEVERLMLEQIARVTTDGLRDEEIDRSRAQLIARHEMDLQDNADLAQTCALNELYGLGYHYAFSTRSRLEALDVEQVRDAAAAILDLKRMAVSLVLPDAAPAEASSEGAGPEP